ncbi:hypothetical protein I9W82_000754 [Candida metapsilosis]|uniref:Uncharacterized protein n=1 Tax=Candida metapsilosis TaxID=273372 RepID=A0A8H7ZGK1_9ASCO|nr:hypothetical protein I9W82_000754 [Candida metapsilosis]
MAIRQTSTPTGNNPSDQATQNPFTDESHHSPARQATAHRSSTNSSDHSQTRSTDILLQQPHEMTQDSLKRLEVESTSSESVSAAAIGQYPYYNLDEMVNSPSSNSQSHVAHNQSGSGSKKFTPNTSPNKQQNSSGSGSASRQQKQPRRSNDGVPLSPIDGFDDGYNQVPKRFSQFIIDQQNPHISQRLDNLSMVSSSLKSNSRDNRGSAGESSGNERETMLDQEQNNYNFANFINTRPPVNQTRLSSIRDDVSESMGSQATIFSTRQEPEALLINRRVGGRINTGLSKTKSLFNKNKHNHRSTRSKVNRTSTVRLYKSPTSSITSSLLMNNVPRNMGNRVGGSSGVSSNGGTGTGTSSSIRSSTSLTRKNAIKTKKGSWWYRLQLKIRQFWTKFKFYNFKASSRKRQVSMRRKAAGGGLSRATSQKPTNLTKSKSLVRKVRENPQNQDLKRLASVTVPPAHSLDPKNKSLGRGSGGKLQISSPINNPQLGKVKTVERVPMNDELKRYAGAGLLPPEQGQQQQQQQNVSQFKSRQLLTPEEIADERTGKYKHLSNYINQQESRYLYQSEMKHGQRQEEIGARARELKGARDAGVSNIQSIRAANEVEEFPSPQIGTSEFDPAASSLSVTTSQAPPPAPPPHLDTSYMSGQYSNQRHNHGDDDEYDKEKITELWRGYLLRVLFNRIQLRQEINQFEQYMVTKETSDVINLIFERARRDAELGGETEDGHENASGKLDRNSSLVNTTKTKRNTSNTGEDSTHAGSPVDDDVVSSSSVYSQDDIISTTTFSTTTSTENEHGDILVDPQDQEFTTTVLNRRSMLAEMLEYHSSEEDEDETEQEDEEDTVSYASATVPMSKSAIGSISTHKSIRSNKSSGLDELRRYGTVVKRPSSSSSSMSRARANVDNQQNSVSGMKRSFGLNHSLSDLKTQPV